MDEESKKESVSTETKQKTDFHKQTTLSPQLGAGEPVVPEEIPKMIGPYTVEALLERGGMSLLYLGTHPDTKAPCAIKVLSPNYLTYPEMVKRFLNEAEIISMADHPNIVKLYGQGEWEGGLYIAMEFIEGIPLRQYLLQTPISLKRALEMTLDISYALCHLHTHGVIHRDLKPENILVNEKDEVKVIDFGIAQLLTEAAVQGAPPKQRLIGTPIYMSPEQRSNPESVSFPSDIYSLGIIAYELIQGKLSHGQLHLSLVPKGMQPILHKCLQPTPEERYQDVADLITDLTAFCHSSSLEKESRLKDRLSELSEGLRGAQSTLSAFDLPTWPALELGAFTYRGAAIAGLFSYFCELTDGRYLIFLGEPVATGAEGVIATAVVRGMVRALSEKIASNPDEGVKELNQLLRQDPFNPLFSLHALILAPEKRELLYSSFGELQLWHYEAANGEVHGIRQEQLALGVSSELPFHTIARTWQPGDTLLLHTFATLSNQSKKQGFFTADQMVQTLKMTHAETPQNQVEIIARRAKLTSSTLLDKRPVALISIQYSAQAS